jgi:hypothetical protein
MIKLRNRVEIEGLKHTRILHFEDVVNTMLCPMSSIRPQANSFVFKVLLLRDDGDILNTLR